MAKTRKSQGCPKLLPSNASRKRVRSAVAIRPTALPTVYVSNKQKDLNVSATSTRRVVQALCELEGVDCKEIAIYFVTEKKICQLHALFFNDPSPTDCITFPIDEEILGEIFVCPKTALNYSSKRDKDPFEELTLYIVHGMLHLLGERDETASERRSMRKKEKKCMAHLKSQRVRLSQ